MQPTKTTKVNMKISLLFLACLLHLSLQDSVREAIAKANTKACLKEGNLDSSMLKQAIKSGMTNDTSIKCFHKCFLTKENLMTPTGELALTPIKEKFVKAAQMIDECNALTAMDACELAFSASMCVKNVFETTF